MEQFHNKRIGAIIAIVAALFIVLWSYVVFLLPSAYVAILDHLSIKALLVTFGAILVGHIGLIIFRFYHNPPAKRPADLRRLVSSARSSRHAVERACRCQVVGDQIPARP